MVRFVDFGNEITVPFNEIFEVPTEDTGQFTVPLKEILQVPTEEMMKDLKLVVPCTLDGVTVKGEHGWSQASKEYFESLFSSYKYKLCVTFLSQKGELYKVALKKRNGESIADNLLALESGQVKIVTNAVHEHVFNCMK